MYSLKAILEKQPVAIASTIRSLLMVAILMGLVAIDENQLAGIALGVELVLGLLLYNNVTPTSAPTLKAGTEVTIQGTEDTTVI